jgi:hypothetical protein
MSVDRKPADRFFSNAEQAERTARHLSDFIQDNLVHLRKVDNSGRMEKAAKSFHTLLVNREKLTPGQLSFLEAIYEKTIRGAGFPAIETHHDKRKSSMRFGR